jgi:hypothetical protein
MTRNLAESLAPGYRTPTLRGRALLDLLARQGIPVAERVAAAREMLRLAELDAADTSAGAA